MSNPLNDPRAKDLSTAVADDVKALWTVYDDAAAKAQWTARGLRACQTETSWKGKAADQFKASIGHFPRQLDSVCNGYWEVANALKAYEGQLRDLQARLSTASANIQDSVTGYQRAQVNLQNANGTYKADLDPANHVPFKKTMDDYRLLGIAQKSFDAAHGDLTTHSRAIDAILAEFEKDRAACQSAVKSAIGYAIEPPKKQGPVAHPGKGKAQGLPSSPTHSGTTGHNGDGGNGDRGSVSRVGSSGGHPLDTNAPQSAKAKVTAMTREADRLLGIGYVYGGGHGSSFDTKHGLDCSSFVSNVLHAGGYLHGPQTTDTLPGQAGIVDGPGKYVTIYDRPDAGDNSHVIIDVNGQFYEEGGGEDGVPENVHKLNPSQAYLNSFTRRLHPAGL